MPEMRSRTAISSACVASSSSVSRLVFASRSRTDWSRRSSSAARASSCSSRWIMRCSALATSARRSRELGLDLGAHAVELFLGLETRLFERRVGLALRVARDALGLALGIRRRAARRGSGGSGTQDQRPPPAPAPHTAQSCHSLPFSTPGHEKSRANAQPVRASSRLQSIAACDCHSRCGGVWTEASPLSSHTVDRTFLLQGHGS